MGSHHTGIVLPTIPKVTIGINTKPLFEMVVMYATKYIPLGMYLPPTVSFRAIQVQVKKKASHT